MLFVGLQIHRKVVRGERNNPGWAGLGGMSLNRGRQDFGFSCVWLPSGQDSKGELTAERGFLCCWSQRRSGDLARTLPAPLL